MWYEIFRDSKQQIFGTKFPRMFILVNATTTNITTKSVNLVYGTISVHEHTA